MSQAKTSRRPCEPGCRARATARSRVTRRLTSVRRPVPRLALEVDQAISGGVRVEPVNEAVTIAALLIVVKTPQVGAPCSSSLRSSAG
jgi:hypothetical protein